MTFHRLTVLEAAPRCNKNPRWKCLCSCGRETIAYSHNLIGGKHKSCGCWRAGPTARNAVEKTIQNGYVFVMEQVLGRSLLPGEEVHHLNGIRSDNRTENLELWNRSHPAGARVEDQVAWAEMILARHAPEKLKKGSTSDRP